MAALIELSGRFQSPFIPLLAALLILLTVMNYRSWNRLRHIPGPPGAAFSKWWMLRNTLGGQMHLALKRACDDYGESALESSYARSPAHFQPSPLNRSPLPQR